MKLNRFDTGLLKKTKIAKVQWTVSPSSGYPRSRLGRAGLQVAERQANSLSDIEI